MSKVMARVRWRPVGFKYAEGRLGNLGVDVFSVGGYEEYKGMYCVTYYSRNDSGDTFFKQVYIKAPSLMGARIMASMAVKRLRKGGRG